MKSAISLIAKLVWSNLSNYLVLDFAGFVCLVYWSADGTQDKIQGSHNSFRAFYNSFQMLKFVVTAVKFMKAKYSI